MGINPLALIKWDGLAQRVENFAFQFGLTSLTVIAVIHWVFLDALKAWREMRRQLRINRLEQQREKRVMQDAIDGRNVVLLNPAIPTAAHMPQEATSETRQVNNERRP